MNSALEPFAAFRLEPGHVERDGDQQMRILDCAEEPWQHLRRFRGKALVQRVDQQHDPGHLTRLAHPLEG